MKKYIGTKIGEARFMTRYAWNELEVGQKVHDDQCSENEGFVVSKNGEEIWLPMSYFKGFTGSSQGMYLELP